MNCIRVTMKKQLKHSPTLNTIIMVEDFLKKNRDMPMKVSEIKSKLPRQVMHQTLLQILDYLLLSGKIIIGMKGVMWIYSGPEHLNKLLHNSIEV